MDSRLLRAAALAAALPALSSGEGPAAPEAPPRLGGADAGTLSAGEEAPCGGAVLCIRDRKDFEKRVLESDRPVVLEFYASWCTPCKVATPALHLLAEEFDGRVRFALVDVSEDDVDGLAAEHQVRGPPTVVYFKRLQAADRRLGIAGRSIGAAKTRSRDQEGKVRETAEKYRQVIQACLLGTDCG